MQASPACRFCHPLPSELEPCYASVLAFPDGVKAAVEDVERDLVPCFTTYCPRCRSISLLRPPDEVALFPCASSHHVHKMVLLSCLQKNSVVLP